MIKTRLETNTDVYLLRLVLLLEYKGYSDGADLMLSY